ncbi:hypothetical protein BVRB_034660, partial [Beta vulgaris subsp. vulgaris]
VAIRRGGNVVVDDGERLFRSADLAAGHAQALEGLRRRHFVNEVTVDVEKTGAVFLAGDDVVVEDLVIEGTGCAHGCSSVWHVWDWEIRSTRLQDRERSG